MSKPIDNWIKLSKEEFEGAVDRVTISKATKEGLKKLILSTTHLELAEMTHDTSAKGLLALFKVEFDLLTGKYNSYIKAGIVRHALDKFIYESECKASVQSRVSKTLKTYAYYYSAGITLKINIIPFTLIQRVVHNVDDINRSALKKSLSIEDDKVYTDKLIELCTIAEYNKLSSDIDLSIIPDDVQAVLTGMNIKQLQEVSKYIRLTTYNK